MDDMTSSSSSSGERDEDGGTDGDFDTAAKGARARGKCQPREILGVVDAIWWREGARVNL